MKTTWLIIGLFVLSLGIILTPIVRRLAHKFNMVAAPRKDRWHSKPTALMGGIAIFLSFISGCLLFLPNLSNFMPILVPATFLFITGVIDDIYNLKARYKLLAQIIAASIAIYYGLRLPWTNYDEINTIITIFWLVGITNAVNLLDNMDGLAGGISLITCYFMTITFLWNGQGDLAIFSTAIGAAICGFLLYNFHPASIFMGDCGSLFLGFTLASTALLNDYGRTRNIIPVLTPVFLLMIPIFDTFLVTIVRKLSGRAISQGGRDHSSHRLVAMGLSEKKAVILLYFLAFISGLIALSLHWLNTAIVYLLLPCFFISMLFAGIHLGKVKVYGTVTELTSIPFINTLADFSYKKHLAELFIDSIIVSLAYYAAYLIRFEAHIPSEQMRIFLVTLPLVTVIQIFIFLLLGVYKTIWRYAGSEDLLRISKSIFIGFIVNTVIVFTSYKLQGPSRAIFLLYPMICFIVIGFSRWSFRIFSQMSSTNKDQLETAIPILIYGAGSRGEWISRELIRPSSNKEYKLIGFIDDDLRKIGKELSSYEIYSRNEIKNIIEKNPNLEIFISTDKISYEKIKELYQYNLVLRWVKLLTGTHPFFEQEDGFTAQPIHNKNIRAKDVKN